MSENEPNVEVLIDRAGDWQARFWDYEVMGCIATGFEAEAQRIIADLMLCLAAAPVPCAASPADGWFDVKQDGETVAWFKSREDAEAYTGTLIARELPR